MRVETWATLLIVKLSVASFELIAPSNTKVFVTLAEVASILLISFHLRNCRQYYLMYTIFVILKSNISLRTLNYSCCGCFNILNINGTNWNSRPRAANTNNWRALQKKKTKNVIRNINMQPCNIIHISIVNYVINPESFISKVYPQRS